MPCQEDGFERIAQRMKQRSELAQRAYQYGRDVADLPD